MKKKFKSEFLEYQIKKVEKAYKENSDCIDYFPLYEIFKLFDLGGIFNYDSYSKVTPLELAKLIYIDIIYKFVYVYPKADKYSLEGIDIRKCLTQDSELKHYFDDKINRTKFIVSEQVFAHMTNDPGQPCSMDNYMFKTINYIYTQGYNIIIDYTGSKIYCKNIRTDENIWEINMNVKHSIDEIYNVFND